MVTAESSLVLPNPRLMSADRLTFSFQTLTTTLIRDLYENLEAACRLLEPELEPVGSSLLPAVSLHLGQIIDLHDLHDFVRWVSLKAKFLNSSRSFAA